VKRFTFISIALFVLLLLAPGPKASAASYNDWIRSIAHLVAGDARITSATITKLYVDDITSVTTSMAVDGTLSAGGASTLTGGATVGASGTKIIKTIVVTATATAASSATATVPSLASVSGATGYVVKGDFRTNSTGAIVQYSSISSTTLTRYLDKATTGTLATEVSYY
jgi:hypothetical protein